MRLSKTAWLILALGILIIAFISLYMLYLRERQAQEQVNDTLTTVQNTLTNLASENSELEGTLADGKDKLEQATSKLQQAQANFPTSVESIEIDEQLFGLAYEWDLEIIDLTSAEPRDKAVEDVSYFVTSFTVKVKGEVSDVLNFVNTMITREDFKTVNIELVNITVPELLSDAEKATLTEEELEERETPESSIKIVIFGYKGE